MARLIEVAPLGHPGLQVHQQLVAGVHQAVVVAVVDDGQAGAALLLALHAQHAAQLGRRFRHLHASLSGQAGVQQGLDHLAGPVHRVIAAAVGFPGQGSALEGQRLTGLVAVHPGPALEEGQ
jgi:hypothetical protein